MIAGLGSATSTNLRSSVNPPHPGATFLGRDYPAFSVVRASPSPCQPSLTLAEFRLVHAHTTEQGIPCYHVSLFHACRRQYPGGSDPVPRSLFFPGRYRLSPFNRKVGSRVAVCEACLVSTHVPACMVAELPKVALCHQSASVYIITSANPLGLLPTESDICLVGFYPPGRRLSTAHRYYSVT